MAFPSGVFLFMMIPWHALGGVVKFTVIPVKTGIQIRLERDGFLNLATCGFRPVSENPEYRVTLLRRNDRIGRWMNVFPSLTTPPRAIAFQLLTAQQPSFRLKAGIHRFPAGQLSKSKGLWIPAQGRNDGLPRPIGDTSSAKPAVIRLKCDCTATPPRVFAFSWSFPLTADYGKGWVRLAQPIPL